MDINEIRRYAAEALKTEAGRKKAAYALIAVAVPLAVVIAIFFFYGKYFTLKRTAAVKKADLERFKTLEAQYLSKRAEADSYAGKAALNGRDISIIISSIAVGLGVSDRVASVRPTGESSELGYQIKEAEVKLERIDLNRLVNFLYRIEDHDTLLKISELTITSRFDNPELLDVRLRVSQIKRL